MKRHYESAEMEILHFIQLDVLTSSLCPNEMPEQPFPESNSLENGAE